MIQSHCEQSSPTRSLCVFGWILLALLTRETTAQCAVGPAPGSHPVRGLLERYEAGPGCSARESGPKETHVIAVGRASHSTENKVAVLLTPLASGPLRIIQLLLSSKQPVIWCLEGGALLPSVTVMVQMSSHSSMRAGSVEVQLQKMPSLPFRPRALHRWALRRHGNITSMIHSAHSNHVYIKLGQDLNQSFSCHLVSAFLSNKYMISDVQPQEVQSCSLTPAPPHSPEVHIIKLHSAGSGLCGSLQVEVVVSLIPSVQSRSHNIVLIISSSVPVNWAIVAKGIQGRVDIYSSNSVSAPSPSELNLSVSSRVHMELASVSDLLVWAKDKGFPSVTSYTEADLANRFRVHLTRPGTEGAAQGRWATWLEEHWPRQRLSDSDAGDGNSFTVSCDDGQLRVAVDQSILQRFSVPYAAVTFRDLTCQAQSNGSHFLLVFPVISCQTEGDLLGHSGGVQYNNTFSCLAPSPILTSNGDVEDESPPLVMAPWPPQGSTSEEQMEWPSPRHRPGPVLAMRLFMSDTFEETRIGPCVITAEHRVYAEVGGWKPLVLCGPQISVKGASADLIEVKSCIISPLSDPKKSPFWSVIWDSCSSDDSLKLHPIIKLDNNSTEVEHKKKEIVKSQGDVEGTEKSGPTVDEQRLRFSFIMRAQYNESMQFLHCSLLLCSSHVTRGASRAEPLGCAAGTPIPPLGSTATTHQCEIRNLSRPMVVTRPISSLVSKQVAPPAGQRFKRLCVSPSTTPGAEDISSMMQVGPLLAIVFTAFVMGTCLMGGLWFSGDQRASHRQCTQKPQSPESILTLHPVQYVCVTGSSSVCD
uniref:TGFBR3/Endoglin-like N-terminal domain-containing protein n=1 Tax=Knipowitschia caucasica TaxID=637954 RepID=A0AAV2KF41_KNICA